MGLTGWDGKSGWEGDNVGSEALEREADLGESQLERVRWSKIQGDRMD